MTSTAMRSTIAGVALDRSITGQVASTRVVAHRIAGRNGRMIQTLVTSSPPMNSTVSVIRPRS